MFNGAPYCEETSDGRVRFMDLTIPQFGIRQYDWIISLEVAEHIPEKPKLATVLSLSNIDSCGINVLSVACSELFS
jgi:2-polyprenyl-3-methyl-5-hydroxy-6-metoxy-1,4-benzoquinol methylase